MSLHKKITFTVLSIIFFLFACKKEISIEAQKFGLVNLNNQTTNLSPLSMSFKGGVLSANEGVTPDLRLPIGKDVLNIKDNKGNLLIDTLINIEENSLRNLVLFKPSESSKAILLENNQDKEPKPEAGLIKIKIANLAPHCFPTTVDVVMKMMDYNYGDEVDMDVIKDVQPAFADYKTYQLFDISYSDGNLAFFINEPVSNMSKRTGFADINDYNTGKFFNVLTLMVIEQENANGAFTGKDGKKYSIDVKALFIN